MVDTSNKVSLLTAALVYMDSHGILPTVKKTCKEYEQMKNSIFYLFVVEVDSLEILNENPLLGNLLLNSPQEAMFVFQEIIYHYIVVLKLLDESITINQISVVLRLISIPNIPGVYVMRTFCDLLAIPEKTRMVVLEGIVVGVTAISQYTQHTMYVCPQNDCYGSRSKEYIRTHVPGALEAQTIRNNFLCFYCGSILEEMKPCRSLADKVIAEVIPSCAFSESNTHRYQAIPVYVRGELAKYVVLGGKHQFFGIVRRDFDDDGISIKIEANNITAICDEYFLSDCHHLPNNLRRLFQQTASMPWRFASSLAYLFAAEITPPGSFWMLKLCILLNLVSNMECKNLEPLHLLVIGKDTCIIAKLLLYGLRYCCRTIKHTTNNHLTGRVSTDMYGTAPYFVEAGSLLLASNGICYLGDISRYKKSMKENLQTILTERKIKLEVNSKFTEGLPQVIEYSLKCRIWAYDPSSTKTLEDFDDSLLKCNTADMPNYLLDAFSFSVFIDCEESDEVLHHLLYGALNQNDDFCSIDTDLVGFLNSLQGWKVTITKESEQMLKNYYLASRRARSINMDCTSIPTSALKVLTQIAQSFAKLSLRHKAIEADAIMAIRLYEESLMSRFGMSVFDIHLSIHHKGKKLFAFLEHNDAIMMKFFSNFMQCCTRFRDSEEQ